MILRYDFASFMDSISNFESFNIIFDKLGVVKSKIKLPTLAFCKVCIPMLITSMAAFSCCAPYNSIPA